MPRSKRHLLAQYYGVSTPNASAKNPLDFKDPSFVPESYHDHVKNNFSASQLHETHQQLQISIAELKSKLQSVVYDNYAKFTSAGTVIQSMTSSLSTLNSDLSSIDDAFSSLNSTMNDLSPISFSLSDLASLADRCGAVKQLSHLLDLPLSLERFLEYECYGKCVCLYLEARPVFEHSDLQFVEELKINLESIVKDLLDLILKKQINSNDLELFWQGMFNYSIVLINQNNQSTDDLIDFVSDSLMTWRGLIEQNISFSGFNLDSIRQTFSEIFNQIWYLKGFLSLLFNIPNLSNSAINSFLNNGYLIVDFLKEISTDRFFNFPSSVEKSFNICVKKLVETLFSKLNVIKKQIISDVDGFTLNFIKLNHFFREIPAGLIDLFNVKSVMFSKSVCQSIISHVTGCLERDMMTLAVKNSQIVSFSIKDKSNLVNAFLTLFKTVLTQCHPLIKSLNYSEFFTTEYVTSSLNAQLISAIYNFISHLKNQILKAISGNNCLCLIRILLTFGQDVLCDVFDLIDDVLITDEDVVNGRRSEDRSNQSILIDDVFNLGQDLFSIKVFYILHNVFETVESSCKRDLCLTSKDFSTPSILSGLLVKKVSNFHELFKIFPDPIGAQSNIVSLRENLEYLSPRDIIERKVEIDVESLFDEVVSLPQLTIKDHYLKFSHCQCLDCADFNLVDVQNFLQSNQSILSIIYDEESQNSIENNIFNQSFVCSLVFILSFKKLVSFVYSKTELNFPQIQLDVAFFRSCIPSYCGHLAPIVNSVLDKLLVSAAQKVKNDTILPYDDVTEAINQFRLEAGL
ncbi:hypothetical protein P9112_003413 [Eukaryota sp. TZLM1-RC]